MILHVASDIHLEFLNKRSRDKVISGFGAAQARDKADGLVLAGDICELDHIDILQEFLLACSSWYTQIFYVPGNHEFFKTGIKAGLELISEKLKVPGLHHLTPGVRRTVQGLSFTGGTLWYRDCGVQWLKRDWIDYNKIPDAEPQIHLQHSLFTEQEPGDIVVSHMMPTMESVGDKWQFASTNRFFVADIDKEIEAWAQANVKPRLWVHGHTHDPKDFVSRHGFRVYCNPMGYSNEGTNHYFWERLRVEV